MYSVEPYDKCVVCPAAAAAAAYPPLYPNFGLAALDTPLKYHEQELSYAGISLKDLVRSGKKVRGGSCRYCYGYDSTTAAGHLLCVASAPELPMQWFGHNMQPALQHAKLKLSCVVVKSGKKVRSTSRLP